MSGLWASELLLAQFHGNTWKKLLSKVDIAMEFERIFFEDVARLWGSKIFYNLGNSVIPPSL